LATFLYGLYLNKSGSIEFIPYFHFFVMGILCGIISQIGDWAASAIKRYVKVKDFGSIMPGTAEPLTGLTVYCLRLLWYTFI